MKKQANKGSLGTSGDISGAAPAKIKYCLYARKSTEQDELQALSIESQLKEMTAVAERDGLDVVDVKRESHSAKDSGGRQIYNQLIAEIRRGLYNGILTWAPDRLARNAGDLGAIVDLMDQKALTEICTFAQRFTNSPNDKFLLMILGSQAKLENDNKGENVKRGLRAKAQMGWRPGMPPLGYFHDRGAKKGERKVLLDPERAKIIKEIFEKSANQDYSGREILDWLNKIKFTTRSGCKMALSRIYTILHEPFYYGKFEYPVGSGILYDGKHTPLITKELFDKAQEQLEIVPRLKPGTKEFFFTRLIKCGTCGAGITAEEKFKKLSGGGIARYVYYHCGRGIDPHCPEKYIREEELIVQLLGLLDKVAIDKIGARERLQQEIEKYKKFAQTVLGEESITTSLSQVNIRNYAKYILIEGTREEKRELLSCLKSEMFLKNQKILLELKK